MASKNKKRSVSTTATPVVENKSTKTAARSFTPDFSADIEYTKQDLKHIAYLAAAFFVILIVLSFILR